MPRLNTRVLVISIALLFHLSFAQDLSQKAINLVAAHPAFTTMLAANEGWQAESFNTQNIYGIWRVQFWDAEGNELARADLNPENEEIYDWVYQSGINDQEEESVTETLIQFINSQSRVTDLIGTVNREDVRISYHNAHRHWRVRINRQQNSLRLILTPQNPVARSVEGLELSSIEFDNLPSYEDWRSGNAASLVAIAFQERAIADRLRGNANWVSEVERLENQNWQVRFLEAGTVLALARVDPFEALVLSFDINP